MGKDFQFITWQFALYPLIFTASPINTQHFDDQFVLDRSVQTSYYNEGASMKNLSIMLTIILLAVVLFGLQLIYASTVSYRLNTMVHHIEKVDIELIPTTKFLTKITEHQLKQEIEFERAFKFALEMGKEPGADKHFEQAISSFQRLNNQIEHEIAAAEELLRKAIKQSDGELGQAEFKDTLHSLESVEVQHLAWAGHVNEVFPLLREGHFHQAELKSQQVEREAAALEKDVISALTKIEQDTKDAVHRLAKEDKNIMLLGILMTCISLVIAVALTRFIIQNLKRDMRDLKHEIDDISEGDLATIITSKLGKEFGMNVMREKLHAALLVVEKSSNDMLGASNDLAKVSTDVNHSLAQQSHEIGVISAAMTEMEATTSEVAKYADNTQSSTKDVVEKSHENMQITAKAMDSIAQLTNIISGTSDNILELEQHSNKIGSVLGVIKGIAEQTNLLALNAAIEAARAGEQGRGFAVVADEVRNLAQRTQQATVEIEAMVTLFTQGTETAVKSMSDSSQHSDLCRNSTEQSNNKIVEIQAAMEQINQMNEQISTAAEQQSSTTQELSRNTLKIHNLTQDNADSMTQLSAASEELRKISLLLQGNVKQFKLSESH